MIKSIPVPDECILAGQEYIDELNTGAMTVYEFKPVVEEDSGITDFKLVPVLTDIPCRVGFQGKESASMNEPAQANKPSRIITAVDVDIKEGAILEIVFRGETYKCKRAGKTHTNDFRKSIPVETYEEHTVKTIYEGESE